MYTYDLIKCKTLRYITYVILAKKVFSHKVKILFSASFPSTSFNILLGKFTFIKSICKDCIILWMVNNFAIYQKVWLIRLYICYTILPYKIWWQQTTELFHRIVEFLNLKHYSLKKIIPETNYLTNVDWEKLIITNINLCTFFVGNGILIHRI